MRPVLTKIEEAVNSKRSVSSLEIETMCFVQGLDAGTPLGYFVSRSELQTVF